MTALVQAPIRPAAAASAPASLWRRWRYTGGRRDVRLDLLRGFSAFAMVVYHIGGERSLLYWTAADEAFHRQLLEASVGHT